MNFAQRILTWTWIEYSDKAQTLLFPFETQRFETGWIAENSILVADEEDKENSPCTIQVS